MISWNLCVFQPNILSLQAIPRCWRDLFCYCLSSQRGCRYCSLSSPSTLMWSYGLSPGLSCSLRYAGAVAGQAHFLVFFCLDSNNDWSRARWSWQPLARRWCFRFDFWRCHDGWCWGSQDWRHCFLFLLWCLHCCWESCCGWLNDIAEVHSGRLKCYDMLLAERMSHSFLGFCVGDFLCLFPSLLFIETKFGSRDPSLLDQMFPWRSHCFWAHRFFSDSWIRDQRSQAGFRQSNYLAKCWEEHWVRQRAASSLGVFGFAIVKPGLLLPISWCFPMTQGSYSSWWYLLIWPY